MTPHAHDFSAGHYCVVCGLHGVPMQQAAPMRQTMPMQPSLQPPGTPAPFARAPDLPSAPYHSWTSDLQLANLSSQAHQADKPAGIVLIVMSSLHAFHLLLLLSIYGAANSLVKSALKPDASGNSFVQTASPDFQARYDAAAHQAVILILLSVLLAAFCAFGGFGITQSRKWGFVVTIVAAGIGLASNSLVGGTGALGFLLSLAAIIYSVLRLAGNLPPKVRT